MIYNKKSTNEDSTIKITSQRFSFTPTQNTLKAAPKEQTAPLQDDLKTTPQKKQKKHGIGVLMFAAIFTAVGLFSNTPVLSSLYGKAQAAFSSLTKKNSDYVFSPSFSPIEARTLYTVEYKSTTGQSENYAQSSAELQDTPSINEKAELPVMVQQSTSLAYSDGVNYLPITQLDLSGNILTLSNETSYSPDTAALLQKTPSAAENLTVSNEPLVLIIHTHAGECYTKHDEMYPENEPTRDYEGDNMLSIGREVKNVLSDFGICAIHSETMHDRESFINAYSNSAKTVKKYLEEYPSIKFVIDIHRDAIVRSDGESIKPVIEIAGQKYAQLMFVVGTDQKGHNHPKWQENLSLALNVMQKAEEFYPGLFRSINLRDVPFNQQLSTGYLLLEAGTVSNLKEEALLSARAFAQSLAAFIYNT